MLASATDAMVDADLVPVASVIDQSVTDYRNIRPFGSPERLTGKLAVIADHVTFTQNMQVCSTV